MAPIAHQDLRGVQFVINKRVTIGGVDYVPGDAYDTSRMSTHKIAQLLRQRLLRPAAVDEPPADINTDPEPDTGTDSGDDKEKE